MEFFAQKPKLISIRQKKYANTHTQPKSLKFVHITKCGGTTVEELSKGTLNWGRFDMILSDAASEIPIPDGSFWHAPPRYYLPYIYKQIVEKADFFVVVRNPYTRVISEYYCPWGGPKYKNFGESRQAFNRWIYNKLIGMI